MANAPFSSTLTALTYYDQQVFGITPTNLLFGNTEVSVPNGAALDTYISAYNGTGTILVIDPGTVTINANNLPALTTKVRVRGSGTGLIDTTATQTQAQLEAGQSVIQITAVPTAANTIVMKDLLWENVVFEPQQVISNRAFLWGTSSVRNFFYNTSILNPKFPFSIAHGTGLRLDHQRITTSSDATGTTIGPWNIPIDISVYDAITDGNFTSSLAASPFGANVFGAGTVGVSYGLYYFNACKFYPSGVYSNDAAIDNEYGGATRGPTTQVVGGEIWNSKIYVTGCPNTWVGGGLLNRTTSVASPGGPLIIDAGTSGANNSVGNITMDGVVCWSDDSATSAGLRSVYLFNLPYYRSVNILNSRFIINGASITTNGAIVDLETSSGATGQAYGDININNVEVGLTSAPGTTFPFLRVGAKANSSVGSVNVNGLKFLGATQASGGMTSLVGGAVISYPVSFGLVTGGVTTTFGSVHLDGIDTSAITPVGPTATAPQLYTISTSGTLSATVTCTSLYYGPKNVTSSAATGPYGALFNTLKAQSSLVGSGALLNYTPLADGFFETGGLVNIITSGSASMAFHTNYTDENNVAQTLIHFVSGPGTGTGVAAGAMTSALPWSPQPQRIWAKAGTVINLFVGGTTATSYDIAGYIRQVA